MKKYNHLKRQRSDLKHFLSRGIMQTKKCLAMYSFARNFEKKTFLSKIQPHRWCDS